jgi:hypothetical protein
MKSKKVRSSLGSGELCIDKPRSPTIGLLGASKWPKTLSNQFPGTLFPFEPFPRYTRFAPNIKCEVDLLGALGVCITGYPGLDHVSYERSSLYRFGESATMRKRRAQRVTVVRMAEVRHPKSDRLHPVFHWTNVIAARTVYLACAKRRALFARLDYPPFARKND